MPDLARGYNNRGGAYHKIGKCDLAIKDFTKVIELKPDDVMAYTNRALTFEEKGDFRQCNCRLH